MDHFFHARMNYTWQTNYNNAARSTGGGGINPLNPDYNVSHRDDGNVLVGLYCICHLDIIIAQWK